MAGVLNLMGSVSPNAADATALRIRSYFGSADVTAGIFDEYDEAVVRRFSEHGIACRFLGSAGVARRQLSLSTLRPLLRGEYGLIHVYGGPAMTAPAAVAITRLQGTPIVCRFNGYVDPESPLRSAVADRLERFVLRHADEVVFNSTRQKRAILAQRRVDREAGVTVIPPGVDTDQFAPVDASSTAALRADVGLEGVPVVGACLTPRPVKGIDRMIDLLDRLRDDYGDVRLVIVGDSEHVPRYERLAVDAGVGDAIEWVGSKALTELSRWYSLFDVTVMTSDFESFGLSITESYLCGTPAVAFDRGGMADQIEHGTTGFLVDPYELAPFADYVGRLLTDGSTRSRFAREGRRHVAERFSLEAAAASYESVLERLPRAG